MKIHEHPYMCCQGYPVGENINQWLKVIPNYIEIIKSYVKGKNTNIDLVVTGSSGSIIGALIASQMPEYMNLKIVHIKKQNEDSHWESTIRDIKHIFFIDDFISMGFTLDRVNSKIKKPYNVIVCGEVDMLRQKNYQKIKNFHCQKWELWKY